MYTNTRNDSDLSRKVMERIGKSWDDRVAVRQDRLDLSRYYDGSIPDFPISMVPFWHEPAVAELEERARLRLLAAAWVAYNEKAIYLEDEVVLPFCRLLLKDCLPGASDPQVKQVLAQIQVDEQFHILMCLDVCNNARARHGLSDYVMPEPLVGRRLREILARCEDATHRLLAMMAYASVAEMSINAYLQQVATDETIQPLNRINTDMHRRDELVHGTAFREIVASVYRALEAQSRERFRSCMREALADFTSPDFSSWASILDYLDVRGREEILRRLESAAAGTRLRRDYAVLAELLNEIGMGDSVA